MAPVVVVPWSSSWSGLWPAFVVMAYFVVAFTIFSLRTWMRGMPTDAEVMGRSDSPVLSRFLRHFMMWLLSPWQRLLVRSGIAAGFGRFALAGWLYFLCGILDILDGRVARIRKLVSPAGAFFDSVIDRYAELFVFSGMAVFYKDSWALGAVLLASLGSIMVSYARARGESLGVNGLNIGLMQRPERLFYLGMSMIWSPIVENAFGHGVLPPHALVVLGLVVLAVSTNITAVRRIQHTMARLSVGITPVATAIRPEPRPVPVERPQPIAANSAANLVPLHAAGRLGGVR